MVSLDVEIDATCGEEALKHFVNYLLSYPGVKIEHVSEDLVNTSEIAFRLGVSREAVRTWTNGARGPSDFPPHRAIIGGQKIWAWATVYAWCEALGKIPADLPVPIDLPCVEWFNGNHPHLNSNDSWAITRAHVAAREWLSSTPIVETTIKSWTASLSHGVFVIGDATDVSRGSRGTSTYAGREGGTYTRTSRGTMLAKA